jgi:hypothetical protein
MATAVLTEPELRSEVTEILGLMKETTTAPLAIGLRTEARWAGPEVVEYGGHRHKVVTAASVLEIREALAEAEETGTPVIVLTPLDSQKIGRDVLGRLARGRLYAPDLWQAVLHAFKARRAASSLQDSTLIQALINYAPPDGYPPVPTGVLDEATVWRALYRHAFGVEQRDPDLAEWLRWAASEPGRAAYDRAPQELRWLLRRRIETAEGAAAASVLKMIDSGVGSDAVALAIVCGVIFRTADSPSPLPDAAARLERYHGDTSIEPKVGVRLAEAAAVVIAELRLADRHQEANRHIARADELLVRVHADAEAHRSRLSILGFTQRLDQLGRALAASLAGGEPSADSIRFCEDALRAVAEHDQAGREAARLDAAQKAVRLIRWPGLRAKGEPPPTPFSTLAAAYLAEGSFVDWARDAIIGGDPLPVLAEAYKTLEAAAACRRDVENRAFATALAEWSSGSPISTGDRVVPIEQTLARFIAPLAKGTGGLPVLLIVLDGLSWAIAHPLFETLRAGRWHEVTPEPEGRPLPPTVAALPTVTAVSRASLLAGQICRGDASKEKTWFAEHPALREASRAGAAPVLFHKAEIDDGGRGRLDPGVRAAIDSEKQRIVAVVVNAVDEHLAGSSQIEWSWTPERIRPLRDLLEAAFAARRIVAIAADHGHVLHREGDYRSAPGSESRWRPDATLVQPDEVRITGPRVLGPGGVNRAILLWRETTRYAKKHNGYHGGVTPQEALAPFALLAPVPEPGKGLVPCRVEFPAWWLETPPPEPAPSTARTVSTTVTHEDDYAGLALFQAASSRRSTTATEKSERGPSGADWVDRLLASEVFGQQRQVASRLAPRDEQVALVLRELDLRGGQMTTAAFAVRIGLPALRVPGFVAQLQRMLNVDGYPILNLDRERDALALDVPLLKRQFELE